MKIPGACKTGFVFCLVAPFGHGRTTYRAVARRAFHYSRGIFAGAGRCNQPGSKKRIGLFRDFKKEDFQVFDNGHEVPIQLV